nr:MAG TPA: hypothetical protein [Caudoviricetes sp.]
MCERVIKNIRTYTHTHIYTARVKLFVVPNPATR